MESGWMEKHHRGCLYCSCDESLASETLGMVAMVSALGLDSLSTFVICGCVGDDFEDGSGDPI